MPPVAHGEMIASTYVVRDEIARTDTGIVYEARDMLLDRLVALKLGWRDPGTPSMILEARRCAAVRDPCAVAIHGMGTHEGVEFVVGERVTGTLLCDLLEAALPAPAYLARLRTLVAAVAHAHACGIAIGDLSGATILVTPDRPHGARAAVAVPGPGVRPARADPRARGRARRGRGQRPGGGRGDRSLRPRLHRDRAGAGRAAVRR